MIILENRLSQNIGVKIVLFFDLIVSIMVGIKCIPSNVHIFFRILIIIAIFFAAMFIMNIKKFGIGILAIAAVSCLFTWVINGLIISPYVEDNVWKWVLRVCAFLICFLGHLKLTIWDEVMKDKISG